MLSLRLCFCCYKSVGSRWNFIFFSLLLSKNNSFLSHFGGNGKGAYGKRGDGSSDFFFFCIYAFSRGVWPIAGWLQALRTCPSGVPTPTPPRCWLNSFCWISVVVLGFGLLVVFLREDFFARQ